MAVAAPLLVDPHSPTPPRHGLLSVAEIVSDGDSHWVNGVEYDAPRVPAATVGDVSCTPAPRAATEAFDETVDGEADVRDDSLVVWTQLESKLVGRTGDELADAARATLAAGESLALEAWLSANSGAASIGGTTIGALDDWLYRNYAGVGMIHVPRGAVDVLHKKKQVLREGGKLITPLGTPVVAGAYDGGSTPGQVAVLATGTVRVRRTGIEQPGGAVFDPITNEATALAQRIYVLSFDKVAATTNVSLED